MAEDSHVLAFGRRSSGGTAHKSTPARDTRLIHSLGLGGRAALGLGTSAGAGELAEGSVLLVVVDEFDRLDGLGGLVDLTDVADTDSGVAVVLVLLDAVLLVTLHSHGEGPLEVLLSGLLRDGDTHLVGHGGSVVATVHGEGRPGPVLAHPASLVAVEFLGEAPKELGRSFAHCYDVLPARKNTDQNGQLQTDTVKA